MPSVYCQSDRREQKAGGIESSMDCSAWRTRGSEVEEDWMQWERKVSMRLMKRDGERRVTPSFSDVAEGSRSGQRERALGPVR